MSILQYIMLTALQNYSCFSYIFQYPHIYPHLRNGNYYIGIASASVRMNKRISMLFTIAAVAVMGATLFGSTYTQTQISGQSIDMSQMDVDMMDQIRNMGGLQLVMPQAFAETDCGALGQTGRTVVEFNLTGESVELPIMGGKTTTQ